MTLGRLAVSVLAGALALGGAVAALADDPQPAAVQAIDLNDDGAVLRRGDAEDGSAAVDDDDDGDGDGDGDDDATTGNDRTGGGDNTGDGDATEGNDGTGGGDNTNSGGSDNTDDGDSGGATTG